MQDSTSSEVSDLLAAYGAGSLDPARHALVASHLLLKPENRGFVRAVENTIADEVCLDGAVRPLARRDARLGAIFDAEYEPPAALEPMGFQVLPEPLRRFMGCNLDSVSWSFVVPGVKECRLADIGRGSASLLRVKAGRRLPQHTHEGSEITLVLTGAFSDPLGRYARGDIAIADGAIEHSPVVDSDEDCICFAVTDAPLVLTSPLGRIVQKIFARSH
ncbi:MAG: ChrR family anti-sigma-E factor [Beijerinckiaceae bacterium]|nr:ChrR family anti-sigma-E factor [Beijerinckiaceae bacterium]